MEIRKTLEGGREGGRENTPTRKRREITLVSKGFLEKHIGNKTSSKVQINS
jgi:hypothetical protein